MILTHHDNQKLNPIKKKIIIIKSFSGLKAKPELNDKRGKVGDYDEQKERYTVKFADGSEVALKAANLSLEVRIRTIITIVIVLGFLLSDKEDRESNILRLTLTLRRKKLKKKLPQVEGVTIFSDYHHNKKLQKKKSPPGRRRNDREC
jgi:hypothetical protein